MGKEGEVLRVLHKTYPELKHYLTYENTFQLLIASILSPQVRDEVVNKATPSLFKTFPTAEALAAADEQTIQEYIKNITFSERKATHIKAASRMLVEECEGNVPQTAEALTALPGVGKKTAFSILQHGFNKIEGIVVDTHVLRVCYRLGWTSNPKNADKTEKELEAIIPKEEWKNIPMLMKQHGRKVCKPTPLCEQCPVTACPKVGL